MNHLQICPTCIQLIFFQLTEVYPKQLIINRPEKVIIYRYQSKSEKLMAVKFIDDSKDTHWKNIGLYFEVNDFQNHFFLLKRMLKLKEPIG